MTDREYLAAEVIAALEEFTDAIEEGAVFGRFRVTKLERDETGRARRFVAEPVGGLAPSLASRRALQHLIVRG